MAFWGNSITSGSDTIDYFVSEEIMEHSYRTRLLPLQDAYIEQVILTEGQGIWHLIFQQKVNINNYNGDNIMATNAYLNYPSGDVFIADTNNNKRIGKVNKTGMITTVAGTNSTSFAGDGYAISAAVHLSSGEIRMGLFIFQI